MAPESTRFDAGIGAPGSVLPFRFMRLSPIILVAALFGTSCSEKAAGTVADAADPVVDATDAGPDLTPDTAASQDVAPDVPEGDPETVAIWQLAEGALPMPNDMFRDPTAGLLKLPVTDSVSPAEADLRTWLNTQPGWSTTAQMTVDFDGPIDPETVSPQTVQVWRWNQDQAPVQLTPNEATWALSDAGRRVTIDPKRDGWLPGATYVGMVQSGADGLKDLAGRPVVSSVVFDWARGDADLPEDDFRTLLIGYLEYFYQGLPESERLAPEDIAVLWPFTITNNIEVLMDRT
ncbi:MAG: hypothetical protein ACI9WU_002570, partial [Myxococcota bacterium]